MFCFVCIFGQGTRSLHFARLAQRHHTRHHGWVESYRKCSLSEMQIKLPHPTQTSSPALRLFILLWITVLWSVLHFINHPLLKCIYPACTSLTQDRWGIQGRRERDSVCEKWAVSLLANRTGCESLAVSMPVCELSSKPGCWIQTGTDF